MIKSNDGQTAVEEVAKQLRTDELKERRRACHLEEQQRAYQLEVALNLTDEWIDALVKLHQRYLDALANDSELFGPRVQDTLQDRSEAILALLAADEARQRIDW
jgi:hypothetical protein